MLKDSCSEVGWVMQWGYNHVCVCIRRQTIEEESRVSFMVKKGDWIGVFATNRVQCGWSADNLATVASGKCIICISRMQII